MVKVNIRISNLRDHGDGAEVLEHVADEEDHLVRRLVPPEALVEGGGGVHGGRQHAPQTLLLGLL